MLHSIEPNSLKLLTPNQNPAPDQAFNWANKPLTTSNCTKVPHPPHIKILTQTLHLHSIEPSSLRNSLKWPLRSSLNRPPSGLRDLLSPSIPQSSVSTFDHSPVPYTLHTYIHSWMILLLGIYILATHLFSNYWLMFSTPKDHNIWKTANLIYIPYQKS